MWREDKSGRGCREEQPRRENSTCKAPEQERTQPRATGRLSTSFFPGLSKSSEGRGTSGPHSADTCQAGFFPGL